MACGRDLKKNLTNTIHVWYIFAYIYIFIYLHIYNKIDQHLHYIWFVFMEHVGKYTILI